jgi:hypothetical protein
VLLALLVYVAIAAMRSRRRVPHWERLAVALALAACASSALILGDRALAELGPTLFFWALAPALFLLLFYLFPDGRFASRRRRWLAVLYTMTQFWHLFAGQGSSQPQHVSLPPIAVVLMSVGQMIGDVAVVAVAMIGIASQIDARYRHLAEAGAHRLARGRALAGALAVGLTALVVATLLFSGPPFAARSLLPPLGCAVVYLMVTLVPVPIAFAVLQVRPYDREALINRALVNGALIICLTVVYAVCAAGVSLALTSSLTPAVASNVGSVPIAIIAATLALAGVFRPLRAWLQDHIDGWLFPRKHAAERTLAGLEGTLPAEIHLDQLSDHVIAAVRQALEPDAVALWVRTAPSLTLQAMERLLPATGSAGKGGGQAPPDTRTWELQVWRRSAGEGGEPVAQTLAVAPDDTLRAALPRTAGVLDVAQLPLESAGVRTLKATRAELAVPLASEGDLLGVLALGPRRSGTAYSFDECELLDALSAQMAPALRVALLVHEQDVEANGRARIEQELSTARRIQLTLLPKEIPTLAGWHLAAYYQPAREVGGDFYDFLPSPTAGWAWCWATSPTRGCPPPW